MNKLNSYDSTITANLSDIVKEIGNVISWIENSWGPVEGGTLFEVRVILNELLANAVKHGSKGDCSRSINISASIINDNYFVLVIEDSGEGCDYKSILRTAEAACSCEDILELKETGRGLLLVKNLCDSVEFNNKGNKIVVEKELIKA